MRSVGKFSSTLGRYKSSSEGFDVKAASFIVIGIITMIYVVVEIGAGVYVHSLVLLSDGFHNLSDVLALVIAYWAQQVSDNSHSIF